MEIRVKSEDGIELSTICRQLKLVASDGKKYETDCANMTERLPAMPGENWRLNLAEKW